MCEAVRGPILCAPTPATQAAPAQEASTILARICEQAPDFEADAFVASEGSNPIKLSDYKGGRIVICFYPGDFTFVWPTKLGAVAARYD
jgi:hypothetical protein